MTTEQTAQQLELAAQILRTGHPWGYRRIAGGRYKYNTPIEVVADGNVLSLLLATPPDNRPLHNPDNLTAEQVGVGYRLLTEDEFQKDAHLQHQEWWSICVRPKSWNTGEPGRSRVPKLNFGTTYRLPLSVPWPEPADPFAELKAAHAAGKGIQILDTQNRYVDADPTWQSPPERYRIKPTESAKLEPAFQLPPPPPGMRWHREDGWKADDLPSGYRPHIEEEPDEIGDNMKTPRGWLEIKTRCAIGSFSLVMHRRTTRPLTFEHAGKTWTYHRPGDPMPCDGERRIECVFADNSLWTDGDLCGKDVSWTSIGGRSDIIGWRYADETKTVPFDISDVPPCSVLSLHPPRWFDIYGVCKEGIYVLDDEPLVETLWKWNYLAEKVKINRSLPLTGKWNPDAWEPCSKTIPA